MATFEANHNGDDYYYKIYVVNHTKSTSINYDYTQLLSGEFVRWISGDKSGTVSSQGEAMSNFDVRGGLLQKGDVSILTLGAYEVHVRFWSSGNTEQYINFIGEGGFEVTEDSETFNEIEGHGVRITLDGGGHNMDTLDIFIQVYDQ